MIEVKYDTTDAFGTDLFAVYFDDTFLIGKLIEKQAFELCFNLQEIQEEFILFDLEDDEEMEEDPYLY